MKNWILTLLFTLGAAAASFGAFFAMNKAPAPVQAAARTGDALEWLRVEFKLTDAQYAAIRRLHEQYGKVCAVHCAAIQSAEQRRAPRAQIAALENRCVESMTEHFQRVAAIMSPAQGRRYLAIVMPRVHDYDHRGAPNLRAQP